MSIRGKECCDEVMMSTLHSMEGWQSFISTNSLIRERSLLTITHLTTIRYRMEKIISTIYSVSYIHKTLGRCLICICFHLLRILCLVLLHLDTNDCF